LLRWRVDDLISVIVRFQQFSLEILRF
jgi:hypothetical protein